MIPQLKEKIEKYVSELNGMYREKISDEVLVAILIVTITNRYIVRKQYFKNLTDEAIMKDAVFMGGIDVFQLSLGNLYKEIDSFNIVENLVKLF